MSDWGVQLLLPDPWQQEALRALRDGVDVIVDAPTGAGKTYIFELLMEGGGIAGGQAVYTVPTRALANDKLLEWRGKGWRVGIATGDLSEDPEAPVLVATLETQRGRLLDGRGPGLLVVDEYQMLADESRGLSYEMALAAAPLDTRLLLLSGTVSNADEVAKWLRRLGRNARVVRCEHRPVPLEELHLEALREPVPQTIRGFWPRMLYPALKHQLGPILVFAPRRKVAEELARKFANHIPARRPLELTREQRALAGPLLTKMLTARVGCHHSGLSYAQRAGLIEPLAKAGQLQIVVATTGLGAGINFSLRSVIVTDREYRHGHEHHQLRADELLQMFGRAGRRGLDDRGYVLTCEGKPRLQEGRRLKVSRVGGLDGSAFLRSMRRAADEGEPPAEAARTLAHSLFTVAPIDLGFEKVDGKLKAVAPEASRRMDTIVEILNSVGEWERKRVARRVRCGDARVWVGEKWIPALEYPETVRAFSFGNPCKFATEGRTLYGREVALASIRRDNHEGEVLLTPWVRKNLREIEGQRHHLRKGWTLARLEAEVIPCLNRWTGARFVSLDTRGEQFFARLDCSDCDVPVQIDQQGKALINPPERSREVDTPDLFRKKPEQTQASSPVATWLQLGLIDETGGPTRRGIIASFFHHGEGLAVAAALEDENYPVEEIALHLANLRAGHRFEDYEEGSSRMAVACRALYGDTTYTGLLRHGVPLDYGNGASEALTDRPQVGKTDEISGAGDLERLRMEWQSLIRHIAAASAFDWERWSALQAEATCYVERWGDPAPLWENLPALTAAQRSRPQDRGAPDSLTGMLTP